MNEFINKLIERLEEESCKAEKNMVASLSNSAANFYSGEAGAYNKTIAIVKQLAEEYKEINIPTIDAGELLGNSEQVKKTNADRIRAMDDEELADYLYKMTLASLTVVEVDSREIAIPKLLKWLQSEAE